MIRQLKQLLGGLPWEKNIPDQIKGNKANLIHSEK